MAKLWAFFFLHLKQILRRSRESAVLMDSLCAESEDFEEMNLDIDNSVTAVEEKTDELVDSDVALESEGSSCLECPCPSMGSDVTPQPVVASVAVHKSLGVWFGEDGSVVQIHPGEKFVLLLLWTISMQSS